MTNHPVHSGPRSRGRRLVVLLACVWLGASSVSGSHAAGQNQAGARGPQAADAPAVHGAVISKYCVTCHNSRTRSGDLSLDSVNLANVAADAAVWEKVIRRVRAGAMPPQGMPQPDDEARTAFVSWLETTIDRAAAVRPNPGRPALHRLNRTEYQNVIRDMLALDVDAASLLPADDSSFGFDNVADVLGVSPVLLERYIAAAETISAIAVGDPAIPATDKTHRVRFDLTQTGHIDGLPLGTRGGTLIRETFPLDGEYMIKPKLWRTNVGFIRGLAFPHQVEITVDGERVHLVTIGTPEDYQTSLMGPDNAVKIIEARMQVRVPVKAGSRGIGVAFVQKTNAMPPTLLQPYLSTLDPVDSEGVPRFEAVTISGPFKPTGPGDTPSRRRIFTCRPASATGVTAEMTCARQIITTLARRAYRRPVTDADISALLKFFQTGRTRRVSMAAFNWRCSASSPSGVRVPGRARPGRRRCGGAYRISDVELASRLSFFLWSSVPDDELLTVAAKGGCRNRPCWSRQVRRMLRDPRASALVSNFAGQWLYLRNLKNIIAEHGRVPRLRRQSAAEPAARDRNAVRAASMHEDRSVLELLTADYTFLNERLAQHYGIPDVYGTHFRRVAVDDEDRRGLLGQGSILTVTSHADTGRRRSMRGKWILENLLGTPPPPPPPSVPALKENAERDQAADDARADGGASRQPGVRGVPQAHGSTRVRDGELRRCRRMAHPSTPSADRPAGQLADGTRMDGRQRLRQALLGRRDVFVGTMTEKMLTYALGRGLEYYDMPTVRTIVRDASRHEYRFSSIVLGDRVERPVPNASGVRIGARRDDRGRSSGTRYDSSERRAMFITKKSLPRRTFLQGMGVTMALPLLEAMVPAMTAQSRTRGAPVRRFGAVYVPAGHVLEPVDASHHGRRLRVHADHEAARTVPRTACRRERARWRGQGPAAGGHATAPGDRGSTASPEADRRCRRQDGSDHRPDDREGDRPGHDFPVARAGDGGLHRLRRRMRVGLQLHLHEHDLLAGTDDTPAHGDQPARRLRTAVRRHRHVEQRLTRMRRTQHPRRRVAIGVEPAAGARRSRSQSR